MALIVLGDDPDTYTALAAGDIILGKGGNDTLTALDGGNDLRGGLGDDVLNGAAGNDSLTGDDEVGTALNILNGFGGDDVIVTRSWSDQVNAGAGNDLVTSQAQITGQVVDGGRGDDTLSVLSLRSENRPIFATFGSTFSFVVNTANGATYMNFEHLEVTMGTGANIVTGGSGDDRILTAYLNGTNATTFFDAGDIRAMGGDDLVAFNGITRVGSGVQLMNGGTGLDSLAWTAGSATIGDLKIDARLGTMEADARLFARFSAFESLSFRTFDPISGDMTYVGFSGVDVVQVGAASSLVNLGAGDDSARIEAGNATLIGGAGNDVLTFSSFVGTGLVNGGIGNDVLVGGNGQADYLGEDGDDVLSAVSTHARLYGGRDDDVLTLDLSRGGNGSQTAVADGGNGFDRLTLTLANAAPAQILNLTGPVTLTDGTLITGVEAIALTLGLGHDAVTASNALGGAADNKLFGMSGNDSLQASSAGAWLDGGSGLDDLRGGAGNDVLMGGLGSENDILRGGGGDDLLIGGIGQDALTGGIGADRFALTASFESGTTASTRDRVLDFSQLQHDVIDLSAVDAVQAVVGVQDFVFVGSAGFSGAAGEVRFETVNLPGQANDVTLIQATINADTVADLTIELRGLFTLTLADFAF